MLRISKHSASFLRNMVKTKKKQKKMGRKKKGK
jgi:hypothetical protein